MDSRRRATLADVAARAGVSTMSASRALRGVRDVSADTVRKVRAAARELGYIGNPLAASLSGQRSGLVGVVLPSVANSVFAEVLAGVAEALEGSGLQPVFGVTDYDPAREAEAIRTMLAWNPSGLIVTGLDQTAPTRDLLADAGLPVVQIMDLDGDPVDGCVGFSQGAAGRAMAQAMADRGLRRIGYVGCNLGADTRARKRLEGFCAGLAGRGLALAGQAVGDGASTIAAGRVLTARLLDSCPDLDGIYYSNDDLAAGGAYHCIAAGIAVPGRLRLAGFNGLDVVASLPVQVATSQTPRRDIGRTAATILREAAAAGAARAARRVEIVPRIIAMD